MDYATYMYVFRVDHLTLDNQLLCSSLEKATSPTPQLSSISYGFLCRVESCVLFPTHFSICTCARRSLFSSCLGSHVGETLWV